MKRSGVRVSAVCVGIIMCLTLASAEEANVAVAICPVPGAKIDAGGVFGSISLSTNLPLLSKRWAEVRRKMRKDTGRVAD